MDGAALGEVEIAQLIGWEYKSYMRPRNTDESPPPPSKVDAVSFSVITPTLNRADHLPRALSSVEAQSVAPLEHIVVDGGSTDGTLDLVAGRLLVTVISEPDDGLYDAINKGIRASSGDVIVLLNDDDTLLPNALEVARQAFVDQPAADMFCGQMILGDVGSHHRDVVVGGKRLQRLNPRAHAAGSNLVNARFIRREVFDRVGLFEPTYRISADTDFLGRCFLAGMNVVIRSTPVYRYGIHPGALTYHGGKSVEETIIERLQIANDRLDKGGTRRERRYWKRWVWWWTFYRLVRWRPAGGIVEASRLIVRDPAGLPDFLVQFAWHVMTRRERRGRPVTET